MSSSGTDRPDNETKDPMPGGSEGQSVHAGNVPLLWTSREAASQGLVVKSDRYTWHPEDVDLGRKDSMNPVWKLLAHWHPSSSLVEWYQ